MWSVRTSIGENETETLAVQARV